MQRHYVRGRLHAVSSAGPHCVSVAQRHRVDPATVQIQPLGHGVLTGLVLRGDLEPVTTTVAELTGRPALTFAEWAREHADEFRVLSTAEVAHGYVDALSAGRLDEAVAYLAPDVIRTAPLESATELKGVAAILENARRLNTDIEYLAVETLGPLLHTNHFAIRFTFTQRNTTTGAQSQTTKLSLCTVESGHITREDVFYYTPAPS